MQKNRFTGLKPDKLDARDVYVHELNFGNKADSDNRTRWGLDKEIIKELTVENQGKHGSCVGQTLSKFLEVEELQKKYSARYIYTMTDTLYEGRDNGGLRPSNAFKFMQTFGGVIDELCEDNNFLSTYDYYDGVVVLPDGKKTFGYARVLNNIVQYKKAFDEFGCLFLAAYKYRTKSRRTGEFVYSNRSGGHAVLATHMEYKRGKYYLHFINSWGKNWGDDGHGFIEIEEALDDGMNIWLYAITRDKKIDKQIKTLVGEKKAIVSKYKYFSPTEIYKLSPDLVLKLDKARGYAGIPFVINSGYRTKARNEEVGGVENSAHLKGLAVDLRCRNSRERAIMIKALQKAGFSRIGIAKTFIHVDIDASKPQEVYWLY